MTAQPYPEQPVAETLDAVTTARLSHLRVARGSADLFPDSLVTLQETKVKELDREALLSLGALGVEPAFEAMDHWHRFGRSEQKKLDAELERNPASLFAAIQRGARYAYQRRNDILPVVANGADDPNHHVYRKFDLYEDIYRQSRIDTRNPRIRTQLQLARISVFGFMLYEKTQRPSSTSV